ncbi:MAG: hypothetical protein EWV92_05695 [Microcystis aeruginosa Ma_MB_S_20031200_S102]|uniref:Uncharacterized protein n=1 Tax=Microcystis aeruginosa Ma_MB_S_20031200_S102 TaxID=2486254 RepID=A0A552F057_MICAE|nr:MAG: hypothetical protein EWV79_06355 [Microcystis aeruginosa Ma_MB_S_20031200_S102D]TRU40066.1 MAG: hypothetical protein EWV92_05695 [Microcystis aeruginosa Ma_MB_S_20031200_S102]
MVSRDDNTDQHAHSGVKITVLAYQMIRPLAKIKNLPAGDRRQAAGDRVIGFWGFRVLGF